MQIVKRKQCSVYVNACATLTFLLDSSISTLKWPSRGALQVFKSDLAVSIHSCPPYHWIMINRYIGYERKLLNDHWTGFCGRKELLTKAPLHLRVLEQARKMESRIWNVLELSEVAGFFAYSSMYFSVSTTRLGLCAPLFMSFQSIAS